MKRCLSVVALALLINACSTSSTGRQQITLFSSGELGKMGAASFEQLKEKEKIYQDSATNQYVRCISNDIIEQLPGKPKASDWEVVVFDSEQVNAFALPGKKIGVYTGILKVAQSPAQLAAIIGHEVAHVIEQHSNERMSSGQLAQIGLQAADAALASQNVQSRNAWMAGLGLGLQYGVLMPYGRTHESEADIVGQKLMAKAGYDPQAAVQLWRNMAKVSKSAPPEFLSTHPSSETRIRQLTNNLPNVSSDYQQGTKGQCRL